MCYGYGFRNGAIITGDMVSTIVNNVFSFEICPECSGNPENDEVFTLWGNPKADEIVGVLKLEDVINANPKN